MLHTSRRVLCFVVPGDCCDLYCQDNFVLYNFRRVLCCLLLRWYFVVNREKSVAVYRVEGVV